MINLQAQVAQLITSVADLDRAVSEATKHHAMLDPKWHGKPSEDLNPDRMSRRVKTWVQVSRSLTNNHRGHMAQVDSVALGIGNVSTVRHDLAHGRLEYGNSDFGPLVQVWNERPLSFFWPHYDGDEKIPFGLIYDLRMIYSINSRAQAYRQMVVDLMFQATRLSEAGGAGRPPDRER